MARPTWDDLRQQTERTEPKRQRVRAIVTGKWESDLPSDNPLFAVTISGDSDDVEEVVELLRDNGNLLNLRVRYKS